MDIAAYLLIQASGLDAVNFRQVGIEHYFLVSQYQNYLFYSLRKQRFRMHLQVVAIGILRGAPTPPYLRFQSEPESTSEILVV